MDQLSQPPGLSLAPGKKIQPFSMMKLGKFCADGSKHTMNFALYTCNNRNLPEVGGPSLKTKLVMLDRMWLLDTLSDCSGRVGFETNRKSIGDDDDFPSLDFLNDTS